MLVVVLGAELVVEGIFLIELELLVKDMVEDSDTGRLLGLISTEFCTDPLAEGIAVCVVGPGLAIEFELLANTTVGEDEEVDTVTETDVSEAGPSELINGPDIVDIDERELLIKTLLGDALIEPSVEDTLTKILLRDMLEVALLKEGEAGVSVVLTLLEDGEAESAPPIMDEVAEPDAIKLPDDVIEGEPEGAIDLSLLKDAEETTLVGDWLLGFDDSWPILEPEYAGILLGPLLVDNIGAALLEGEIMGVVEEGVTVEITVLAVGFDVSVARLLGPGTFDETEVKGATLDPTFVDGDPPDIDWAFKLKLLVNIELLRLRLLAETAPPSVLDMTSGFKVGPLEVVERRKAGLELKAPEVLMELMAVAGAGLCIKLEPRSSEAAAVEPAIRLLEDVESGVPVVWAVLEVKTNVNSEVKMLIDATLGISVVESPAAKFEMLLVREFEGEVTVGLFEAPEFETALNNMLENGEEIPVVEL